MEIEMEDSGKGEMIKGIQCSLIPGNGTTFIGKITCAIDPCTAAADTGAVVIDLDAIHR